MLECVSGPHQMTITGKSLISFTNIRVLYKESTAAHCRTHASHFHISPRILPSTKKCYKDEYSSENYIQIKNERLLNDKCMHKKVKVCNMHKPKSINKCINALCMHVFVLIVKIITILININKQIKAIMHKYIHK